MKLCLFETSDAPGEQRLGAVVEGGVAELTAGLGDAAALPPQARMEAVINGFEELRAEFERIAAAGPSLRGRLVPAARAVAEAEQDTLLHRQLLGARRAGTTPAQHVPQVARRRDRPRRYGGAADDDRPVGLPARGGTRHRHEGPGEGREQRGLRKRGVRLHRPRRRVGAGRRPQDLAGRQLDGEVVRHLCAPRPGHRHR